MATYVDGFVIPLPRKNLAAYKKMALVGRKVWMKHGALQYFECVGDDLKVPKGMGLGFPKGLKLKAGETAIFAFVVYKSKAHRNAVNKKVMSDPAMAQVPSTMPFDPRRFLFGGFQTIVEG
jgi:uncharacterized protein YbaA (DUF1428 family)